MRTTVIKELIQSVSENGRSQGFTFSLNKSFICIAFSSL